MIAAKFREKEKKVTWPTRLSENLTSRSANLDNKLPKASSWKQLMILDPNNTVQPETTFTLSHKRAIYGEATCTRALIHSRDWIFFFQKRKNFDLPGSSNKRLSRSGLNKNFVIAIVCLLHTSHFSKNSSSSFKIYICQAVCLFIVGSTVGVLDCARECTYGQSMVGFILWKCSEDYLTYRYSVVPVVQLAHATVHNWCSQLYFVCHQLSQHWQETW